ncbi:hypothetical protein WJX77_010971 [Trebouxia sp. C0004]
MQTDDSSIVNEASTRIECSQFLCFSTLVPRNLLSVSWRSLPVHEGCSIDNKESSEDGVAATHPIRIGSPRGGDHPLKALLATRVATTPKAGTFIWFWHLPVQLAHLAWMASGIAPSPGQRHGQACQHVRAASHRVQPLCYQQDKRSNVGQGKGAAELRNRRFIYNKACSQSRQRRYSQRRDLNSVQSFHISVHLCEVVQEAAQIITDFTAQDACKAH